MLQHILQEILQHSEVLELLAAPHPEEREVGGGDGPQNVILTAEKQGRDKDESLTLQIV